MIKLTKEENQKMVQLLNVEGHKGIASYFVASRTEELRKTLRRNNNIDNAADELKMLHDIATGNVEIIEKYQAGDIVVRTNSNTTYSHRVGAIMEVSRVDNEDEGIYEPNGNFHRFTNIRPATDAEKKFHALGRRFAEFEKGDRVDTLQGAYIVGNIGYPKGRALQDLEDGQITAIYPVESRVEFNNTVF